MLFHRRQYLVLFTSMAFAPVSAWAVNPVSWQVEISTTGQDVFWTSPTALTTGLAEYDWSYEITELTANVFLLGDQDLLGLLDETSGFGTETGLPFILVDEMLSEPTTGSSVNIRIEVDAAGVGRASGTNITLGSFLGLPIRRVDLTAMVSIIGVPTGDYDRDGDVDTADYQVWRAAFGSTVNLAADGNKNSIVDTADYVVWRNNLGVDTTPGAGQIVIVPEPSSFLVFALAGLANLTGFRRPRRGV
jgi:hypothetical protein